MGVGVPDMSRMKLPVSASTVILDPLLYGFLGGLILGGKQGVSSVMWRPCFFWVQGTEGACRTCCFSGQLSPWCRRGGECRSR